MSILYESSCVGCVPDLPCMGAGCGGYGSKPVYCCDFCDDPAVYHIDGSDFCEYCAKDYLINAFKDLTVKGMAELLEADFSYTVNT